MHASNEARPNLLDVVEGWHRAVNDGDSERLLALASPDIEMVGPRSVSRGHGVLADWLSRAGLSYVPVRWFSDRVERVVVEERVTWRDVDTGELVDEKLVASRFVLAGGVVTRYARHDDVASALEAAGLGEGDEVAAPTAR
ncbi:MULTISPECIES: hypothetical protein [Micromonospora]|uniref:hypothetical protein n=1 Tax=Micromonospora TaxID=1873 RepID=UPI00340A87FD